MPGSGGESADRLVRYFTSSGLEGIAAVYLFGSHAEGRTHRQSDVDIGVLLDWTTYPTSASRFDLRLRLSADLPAILAAPADIVILNDAPPGLGRAIVTGGTPVLLTAPGLDHAYVRDVQLRAADLKPWLERMRRIKLQAIRG
ncbi:hypothetical protein BH24ACI5_BH24ACI5_22270 [soil metagenome]